MAALDFSSTSCERSVARISTRQPARAAPLSFRHIASEYGFLAGRTGGAPDPQALAACARLQDFGHDRTPKVLERNLVAKEEGLVGGHGLDHLGDEASRSALHLLHEFADTGQADFPRQRKQPAFDQILLVTGQIETGMVLQELAHIFIIGRGHGRPPAAKCDDLGWVSPGDTCRASSVIFGSALISRPTQTLQLRKNTD